MPVGIKETLEIAVLLDRSSKNTGGERGKTMKYGYEILVKAALVGVVLIASGCSLGNDEPLVDNLKGLETAFGNAGSDRDGGMPGNGGNRPAPGGDGRLTMVVRPATPVAARLAALPRPVIRTMAAVPAIPASGAARTPMLAAGMAAKPRTVVLPARGTRTWIPETAATATAAA